MVPGMLLNSHVGYRIISISMHLLQAKTLEQLTKQPACRTDSREWKEPFAHVAGGQLNILRKLTNYLHHGRNSCFVLPSNNYQELNLITLSK